MKISTMVHKGPAPALEPVPLTPPAPAPAPAVAQDAPTLPTPGVPVDYGTPAGAAPVPAVAPAPVDPAMAPVPAPAVAPAIAPAVAPAPAPAPAPVAAVGFVPGAPAVAPAPAPAATVIPGVPAGVGAVDINPAPPAPVAAAPAVVGKSFLMRGAAAHTAVSSEQTKADLAASQSGFRFWLKVGGENRITFIDGALDADGALSIPYWYEHRLMIGGKLQNIVCYETLADAGPCPVCNCNHRTQLVAGLSIINHTPYVIQSGQKAGQTMQHRRQMFVAPRTAIGTLQKLAEKRGGLISHCFDVHRKEAKDPRVGSVYDYVGQLTPEQCAAMGDEYKPYDWDDALKLIAPADMQQLGQMAVPYKAGGGSSGATADLHDVDL